ncbi:HD domain-containing protein [Actinoplanes solisilvae]|uniref:HD domain-containing protein n=1 Tax=Actinoplanes solisilvae TaxID=2486853 RepID=UPI0013E34823|nr:ATP-binding protein [Actinoplanes solisilvae]
MGDWGRLGEVLATEASDDNRANVERLVGRARDLLKLVRETFQAYTLHDEQHAENVIRRMNQLVGPRIDALRPLEAALLILAAYFHDVGMVYEPDELARLSGTNDFKAFLRRNDEAFLATRRNRDTPPPGVVEQYCRARHAERVREHLEDCDLSWLRWDGASIINQLTLICRSHNVSAVKLREPEFKRDFRQKADLRFCAIILRLADILDLDQTRAPRVIYDHLKLDRHETPESTVSDAEWLKHIAAGGFDFPDDPERNYTLQFLADPTDPAVEHDLRKFLDVVRQELLECRSVADFCGDRWRGLPLPAEIDASITSHGYKYGEFRFELDREAVLELFTGERLYDDPYAFLRELLQNAFDAVNARNHLYRTDASEVRVHCWDDSGYIWVRVDDDGIGMDEDALRKYFLRVGRSYYRSAEFEAEAGRLERPERSFGAISRFGIGILACFMVGDRVELTSLRQLSAVHNAKAIRVSISRRNDYFTLQEESGRGRPMPGRHGEEDAFLGDPGTHIAVRIDPNRAAIDLKTVEDRIRSYILGAPVPVQVNADRLEAEGSNPLLDPLLTEPIVSTFATAELTPGMDNDFIPGFNLEHISIAAIPLDLGATAIPDVRGQLLAFVPLSPVPSEGEDHRRALRKIFGDRAHSFRHEGWDHSVSATEFDLTTKKHAKVAFSSMLLAYRDAARYAYLAATGRQLPDVDSGDSAYRVPNPHGGPALDLESALRKISDPRTSLNSEFMIPVEDLPRHDLLASDDGDMRWSYNGITMPTESEQKSIDGDRVGTVVYGAVGLSGPLRPDLTISRSQIRAVPWPVHSALQLALRRASRLATGQDERLARALAVLDRVEIVDIAPGEPATAATFGTDDLLMMGSWNSENVIRHESNFMSVEDLRSAAREGESVEVTSIFSLWEKTDSYLIFYDVLSAALLHFFVDLEVMASPGTESRLRVRSASPPPLPAGHRHYRPLFAVDYQGDERLARAGTHLNGRHPLARWLLANADVLAEQFPAPFQRVFRHAATSPDGVDPINEALDRVAKTRTDIAPPRDAYLRADEKGWWWSR